jgi:hypothetical protein
MIKMFNWNLEAREVVAAVVLLRKHLEEHDKDEKCDEVCYEELIECRTRVLSALACVCVHALACVDELKKQSDDSMDSDLEMCIAFVKQLQHDCLTLPVDSELHQKKPQSSKRRKVSAK